MTDNKDQNEAEAGTEGETVNTENGAAEVGESSTSTNVAVSEEAQSQPSADSTENASNNEVGNEDAGPADTQDQTDASVTASDGLEVGNEPESSPENAAPAADDQSTPTQDSAGDAQTKATDEGLIARIRRLADRMGVEIEISLLEHVEGALEKLKTSTEGTQRAEIVNKEISELKELYNF